jgi:hypothetical protein
VGLPIPKGHTFVHYVNDYRQVINGDNITWSGSEGYAIIYGANNTGSKTIKLDDNVSAGRYFVLGCFDDRGYLGYEKIAKVVADPPSSPDVKCKLKDVGA